MILFLLFLCCLSAAFLVLFFLCFSSLGFLLLRFARKAKQLQSRFDSGSASSFFLRARSLCFSSVFFASTHTHTHTAANTHSCTHTQTVAEPKWLMTSWSYCCCCCCWFAGDVNSARRTVVDGSKERERRKDKEKEKGISEEQSKTKSQNFCLEMKFDFNASGCKRSPVTTAEGGEKSGQGGQSVDWVTLGLATHQRHQAVYEVQAQRACDNSSAISLTAYGERETRKGKEKRDKAWRKTAKRRRRKVL